MEGQAREFAPNGKVVRESMYVNGDEVGLVQTFYPSGARLRLLRRSLAGRTFRR